MLKEFVFRYLLGNKLRLNTANKAEQTVTNMLTVSVFTRQLDNKLRLNTANKVVTECKLAWDNTTILNTTLTSTVRQTHTAQTLAAECN